MSQKQPPTDPHGEDPGRRLAYLPSAESVRPHGSELGRESAVATYVFTIEGEVVAESAADAYQAISELFDRMAEARRSGALLHFELTENVRVTLKPKSTLGRAILRD